MLQGLICLIHHTERGDYMRLLWEVLIGRYVLAFCNAACTTARDF